MLEVDLETACLEGLRAALPPEARVAKRAPEVALGEAQIDGLLRIRARGGEFGLPFETKGRVNRGALALIDGRFRAHGRDLRPHPVGGAPRWMLFTEYVAPQLGRDLRKEGIAFADACGNVHLWGPGLFVWVTGNKPATREPKAPRLGRAAAARVLFALLQDPRRAQAPYRELAELADVAPDTVQAVFNDLQRKGCLRAWGTRERALTRLPEVMELWTLAYEDGLRNKLHPKRCDRIAGGPAQDFTGLLTKAPNEPRILLGGEAAAGVLTVEIRPTTATFHVPPGDQLAVMRTQRLVPRPDGAITLLDTFGATNEWTPPERLPARLADPLLIHAELMHVGDDRARGAAEEVYKRHIVDRFA